MICARCRHAFQNIVSKDDTWIAGSNKSREPEGQEEDEEDEKWHSFTHHPTLESFREAIDQRCSVCIILWEELAAEQQSLLVESDATRTHKDSTSGPSREASTSFLSQKRQTFLGGYCINVYLYCPVPVSKTQNLPSSRPRSCVLILEPVDDASEHPGVLTDHTRSPESLSLAKRWVTECVRHHNKCNAGSGDATWYPSRLLDLTRVSSAEPPLEQTVCLIETAKVTPAGRYTTVSHRWGPTEQLRLTRHTYPRLADGLPLKSLPQLLQDAIFVSLELGIRYIWIDLLCIYQDEDNRADWHHESTLMNQVYSNTFCNISAGNANGCLESLFGPRDTGVFLPQVIELKIGHHGDETQLFRVYDRSYWHRSVSRALVNTRAWVLQERFLSPRVLQFDTHQVLWECLEKSATETCPRRIPDQLVGRDHLIFKSLLPVIQTAPNPDNKFLAADIWTCLVKEYTACNLTVPGDKLIAISGIAKHIAALVEDDYVAGMWRRTLEGELLWQVTQSGLPGKTSRPAQYRAPSWSWASIDGSILPGWSNTVYSLIRVEEAHLEYLTGDVFGAVTRGWLRLRGPLRQLRLVRKSRDRGHGWEWDITLESVKVTAPEMSLTVGPSYPTSPELHLDIFQEGFEEENANDMLFAMLAQTVVVSEDKINDRRLEMLLLKLVDREKTIFERIGFAKIGNSAAEAVLEIQRPADAPALPSLEYRDGMHSICIV